MLQGEPVVMAAVAGRRTSEGEERRMVREEDRLRAEELRRMETCTRSGGCIDASHENVEEGCCQRHATKGTSSAGRADPEVTPGMAMEMYRRLL
jgi:hypothetical protein